MGRLLEGLKMEKTDGRNHVAIKLGPVMSRALERRNIVFCGSENSDLTMSEQHAAEFPYLLLGLY